MIRCILLFFAFGIACSFGCRRQEKNPAPDVAKLDELTPTTIALLRLEADRAKAEADRLKTVVQIAQDQAKKEQQALADAQSRVKELAAQTLILQERAKIHQEQSLALQEKIAKQQEQLLVLMAKQGAAKFDAPAPTPATAETPPITGVVRITWIGPGGAKLPMGEGFVEFKAGSHLEIRTHGQGSVEMPAAFGNLAVGRPPVRPATQQHGTYASKSRPTIDYNDPDDHNNPYAAYALFRRNRGHR